MHLRAPETMKMELDCDSRSCIMVREEALGRRPYLIGVSEPAEQSGPDLVTYPRLWPPMERGARGAECFLLEIPQSSASFSGGAPWTRRMSE